MLERKEENYAKNTKTKINRRKKKIKKKSIQDQERRIGSS